MTSSVPPQGSHALGVVVRAAKEFEKETASIVKFWCPTLNIEKLTLGQLAVTLKSIASKTAPPNAQALLDLINVMEQVNKSWVQLKHKDDPPLPKLIDAAKSSFRDLIDSLGPYTYK